MKSKLPLVGVILWGLVFLLLLGTLILSLTGVIQLPFLNAQWSGSDAELIREDAFPLDDLVSLRIKGRAENILVTLVEGDQISVRQYGDPDRDSAFTDSRTAAGGGSALSLAVPTRRIFQLFGWTGEKRLEISLPANYQGDLDLSSVSGEVIFTEGFQGQKLSLSSSSGGLDLGPSTVATLTLDTVSGDIALETADVRGDVKLDTASGTIRAGDIRADNAILSSVSGDVSAGMLTLANQAKFSTTSGGIRVEALSCRDFDIGSVSGEIIIATALSGGGTLHTASGSVSASGVGLTGALSVDTVSGDVLLRLAPGQNCDLKLSSLSGDIHGNAPLSQIGGHNASGQVGTGGHLLSVTTTSGEIAVNLSD